MCENSCLCMNVVWSLLKQKQMQNKKQLSTIFVHRNVEPDPKNPYMVRGILRSRSFYLQVMGKRVQRGETRQGKPSFLTTIHFNHLLSELSPPRSKRKWIFSFPVRGLAAAIQLRGKKELKEREENEAVQTFEVRGHKSLALGARFIWPPGLGARILN